MIKVCMTRPKFTEYFILKIYLLKISTLLSSTDFLPQTTSQVSQLFYLIDYQSGQRSLVSIRSSMSSYCNFLYKLNLF